MTVLAVIFYFADVPDIKAEDDYHLDDAEPARVAFDLDASAFRLRGGLQFFYVAAQAGIFSFFINYMVAEVPRIPDPGEP